MRINVLYFASVREQLGAGEPLLFDDLASAPATVGALLAWLQARSPAHATVLDVARGLRMALDQTLCHADEPLHDGAEVAFFPPVTGG
jgi:molybdopterin synthase sulfur carrier subunit